MSDLLNRQCSVDGCTYEEPRGSREGDFVDGKFVCPDHAAFARFKNALPIVPQHLQPGLERWMRFGIQPGGFLTAVLKGDQVDAARRADSVSAWAMPRLFRFVREFMPAEAQGSGMDAWKRHRGLVRREPEA